MRRLFTSSVFNSRRSGHGLGWEEWRRDTTEVVVPSQRGLWKGPVFSEELPETGETRVLTSSVSL